MGRIFITYLIEKSYSKYKINIKFLMKQNIMTEKLLLF